MCEKHEIKGGKIHMFKEEAKNEEMLYGAYNKLKSYYHYNKNMLFLKKKIAEFEENDEEMQASIKKLAQILVDPLKYDRQIQEWIDGIDYYVLPKAFASSSNTESIFVTGSMQADEPVNKVNFFYRHAHRVTFVGYFMDITFRENCI